MMKRKIRAKKPPNMFRSLLWFLNWDKVDIEKDKNDIILSAINNGSMVHWRWIIRIYGKDAIRAVLKKRLASEFHPESLHLARVIFHIPQLRYAR